VLLDAGAPTVKADTSVDHQPMARAFERAGYRKFASRKQFTAELQQRGAPGAARFWADLRMAGEVAAPGPSDASVALVLEAGAAFTGDIPPTGFDGGAVSWRRLQALGVRLVHPGHGPVRPASGQVRPYRRVPTARQAGPPVASGTAGAADLSKATRRGPSGTKSLIAAGARPPPGRGTTAHLAHGGVP